MLDIISFIFIGLTSGLMTGITGVGPNGIILLLLSVMPFVKDYKTIVGTMLYILLFPVTLFAVIDYYNNKKINFLAGNIIVVGVLAGSFMGSKIALNQQFEMGEKTKKYLTAGILFTLGSFFLYSAYNLKG